MINAGEEEIFENYYVTYSHNQMTAPLSTVSTKNAKISKLANKDPIQSIQ